ncbi:transcriptional regulator [Aequorivita sp. H23M31]|uniref:Transcriptional regulator n=1 Tax=Aequorivita ciconiae TaxID=2494375 RepID=A0A410G4Z6_9FLAO|nr:helix-turn-helix transcriptional regulator [Aequorivita sp. H23M31]QAA82354.1 transcriptional regulator [Aequorivita sp. H23M31]
MLIKLTLDELLQEKGMTGKELAEIIGITEANLSIFRGGKARAVRFSTLAAICDALDCQPGDILQHLRD